MKLNHTIKASYPYIAISTLILFVITRLIQQGRLIICSCNKVLLWAGNPWSNDNSQHISDPYSFSHIQHGFIFYYLLKRLFPRVPEIWRLFIAITIESCWELLENSSFIIEKYRNNTSSVQYEGDTVINSLADIVCSVIGFYIAKHLGAKYTLWLFILIEISMIYLIRDSLIINTIMIVYPIRPLLNWQTT